MALNKAQKTAQLQELKDKMGRAQSIVFAHYIGLTVSDVSELRSKLREQNAEMKVAKKTLMRIAAEELGLPKVGDDTLDGPVACIFSFADPLSGAQIAFKFAKDHNQVALIGGMFEGKILTKAEAVELAKMPSREVLLSMFVGMIQSPLVGFTRVINSPLIGFARALSEVAKKGGAAPAPVAEAAAPAAETPAAEPAPAETPAATETAVETPTATETPDAPAAESSSESPASSDSSETPQ